MTAQAWHELCKLRSDVSSGTLTLDEFAADLNNVRTGQAPEVYRDPGMFFDRTYPTLKMKALGRDVLLRLAGRGGKPVLRLQVAYGGGKTHTLIALLHLAERGTILADHPTVAEFQAFSGLPALPHARVALLPGDKFDVKDGLEVYGPDGRTRVVKTLWGALAYQLGGDAGYARLKAHDEDFTVPAEPHLADILAMPGQHGQGALVLVDEAVWYYRGLVNADPRRLGTIKDFYQVLTQAVSHVPRAVLVASLIASKVEAADQTGTLCLSALEEIFGRIAEPVEPVGRDDVAEVLRRRLFETVPGETMRRTSVDAVMAALQRLPVRDAHRDQAAYDRLIASYPFQPELINVLYQKWTQLDRFQRTRGALRLLAYALRESERRDPLPLVGPAALLRYPPGGLSPALNELVEICGTDQNWTPILTGELDKAREIQAGLPSLEAREVETAVVGTFLHSQPLGQRATPTDLFAMLAHPDIDLAALEEGLRKWRTLSWFLVENTEVWQLGLTPNLTHMHVQAMGQVGEPDIDDELRKRIKAAPSLAIADPGVVVHNLPISPDAVGDDLQLHYLVLGPECAIELGRPLPAVVEAYFNQKSGPQNPRIYRNNLVALAPEMARMASLRNRVREYLGWQRLERPENYKLLTDLQKRELPGKKNAAANSLPEMIVASYNVLVGVDEGGQVQAQALRSDSTVSGGPFARLRSMLVLEERLLATTLDPDLLLPGSYLELWAEGQPAQRVTALMAAFGQFPRLPRLLRPDTLFETLARGVRDGVLVLRLPRPDGSALTWWRIPPKDDDLRRAEMEVQPASQAVLHRLDPELLKPDTVSEWARRPGGPIRLGDLRSLFEGSQSPRLRSPDVLDAAVREAVQKGLVMARLDGASLYGEALPGDMLMSNLELWLPPVPVSGADLLPGMIPEAWQEGQLSLGSVMTVLTARRGYPPPWSLVVRAVDEALSQRLLERMADSGPWPCSPAVADSVRLQQVRPGEMQVTPEMLVNSVGYAGGASSSLRAVKEALEARYYGGQQVSMEAFVGAMKTAINRRLLELETGLIEQLPDMGVHVRRPATVLLAESSLTPAALNRLGERAPQLTALAPELEFTFHVTIAAQVPPGSPPVDAETLQRLNDLLAEVRQGWSFG